MKLIFKKEPDKIFDFGRFLDLIFGASEGKPSTSTYGLVLQQNIFNVSQYSSKIIQYIAFLYPRYSAVQNDNNDKKKKQILKITVSPAKGMVLPGIHKNFTPVENKKLVG